MNTQVRITEVAPRDGLQAETAIVATDRKADLVRALNATRVDEIEISSFVSPKWIPQLGDAKELFALIAAEKPAGMIYSALVPNERGLQGALAVNAHARQEHGIERLIDKISVFTAASEGFSLKNTNATIEETLLRFAPVIEQAHHQGLMVRGYISCIIQCPFDGGISPIQVGDVASKLLDLGIDELDLGDTIGAATPETIEPVIMEVIDRLQGDATNPFGDPTLTLHLHDTFGHASECVKMALDLGVRSFDSAAGGLGGCPYASTETSRAPGNISTLQLLNTIAEMGYTTKVDLDAMAAASKIASGLLP
ncbi:MAG: hydroxymethylglutaryl-CoA lyase [Phycisphaerales bacterium]|nr:hydroxymethylglutaryl-CoA lyase [Phycisphaerales bacterium]